MLGIEIAMITVGILAAIVFIIRYNTGDPFSNCGRRIYAEN